jgi:hypothetical protein
VVRVTDSDRVVIKEKVERMTAVGNCVVSMDCARGIALVGLGGRRQGERTETKLVDERGMRCPPTNAKLQTGSSGSPSDTTKCPCVAVASNHVGPGNDVSQTRARGVNTSN